MSRFVFTSESVSEGHPDKVADYISDSVLDACFEQDPHSVEANGKSACRFMSRFGARIAPMGPVMVLW